MEISSFFPQKAKKRKLNDNEETEDVPGPATEWRDITPTEAVKSLREEMHGKPEFQGLEEFEAEYKICNGDFTGRLKIKESTFLKIRKF